MIQYGECPVCSQWKRVSINGLMMSHPAPTQKTPNVMTQPPMCLEGRGLPPVGSTLTPPTAS